MRIPLSNPPPVIKITKGTFSRQHANKSSLDSLLFPNLSFELPSVPPQQHWCIIGPSLSGKTSLLHALQGKLLCEPPTARSYPYLSTDAVPHHLRDPRKAIRYVGFDGESSGAGAPGGGGGGGAGPAAYLSARYESRRETTDFSLRDFLLGNTELNPLKVGTANSQIPDALLERVVRDLRLEPLLGLPVAFLSNGQGRRARIARALLQTPEVLLLDEPFMGLDPPTVKGLSPLLHSLSERGAPRLMLAARPQDPLPDWITHLIYLKTNTGIGLIGLKEDVLRGLRAYAASVRRGAVSEDETLPVRMLAHVGKTLDGSASRGDHGVAVPQSSAPPANMTSSATEALVEMNGCVVKYGSKTVLGNWTQATGAGSGSGSRDGLVWTIRRGGRWGVFGPNGSGKTTIVSLLCSDHPQAYSLPIKLFGQSRIPDKRDGRRPLTIWDIQSRIGHSSPEVHRHIPRSLSIRQVLENAWADTFLSRPALDEAARKTVTVTLGLFEPELNPIRRQLEGGDGDGSMADTTASWADNHMFGRLSFSSQRVALLLRAVIKKPDIVVLDEAFSGMDDNVRDKCMLFLERGATVPGGGPAGGIHVGGLSERQALVCISHVREECPDCVREWLCLPEANSCLPARFGKLDGPLNADEGRWRDIWGM